MSNKEKKKSYTLNDSQRSIFGRKILPTLLMGSVLWLLGEVLSSMYFSDIQMSPFYIVIYIAIVIIEGLLYLGLFFASKRENTVLVILLYGIFSYGVGFMTLPIVI
ncbi:MAG: hypothetical protein ACTSR5_17555, partial [Promethearchaeota archaeon]